MNNNKIICNKIRTIKKKIKPKMFSEKAVNEFQSNDKQKYELDGKGKLMTGKV